ncbi:tail fiber domain-containing protein [Blastomonas sp.]|uniref:tail fiber domain-containing protein n=1 Tax=Blastomonas sp. TaxID=1909299 RepID=UPI00391A4CDE
MPDLFFADLVRETSTSTGIGPVALDGATPGHRRFADAVPTGQRFHYAIAGVTHEQQWEVGEGEIADGALLRHIVLASSAGGDLVDLLAGLKIVSLTVASAWFAARDEPGAHNHDTLAFADGSAAAPTIGFAGDSDTGLFRPAANTLGIAIGGAEAARFAASGGLGIGTETPAGAVHVRWNGYDPFGNTTPAMTLDGAYGGGLIFRDGAGYVGLWATESGDALNVSLGGISHMHALQITPSFVRPAFDAALALGQASTRFSQLYAMTGTINTSDATAKLWRGGPDAQELAAGRALMAELGFFQWLDAIEAKGAEHARRHYGLRAQNAFAILSAHGLDWRRYGWCCHDRWTDEDGEHERFGIRPDQLALFLVTVLARQIGLLGDQGSGDAAG